MRSTAIVIIISALLAGETAAVVAALVFARHGSILSYSYGGTP